MTTEEKKEKYLKEPIKVGDEIYVKGLGIKNKLDWGRLTTVQEVLDNGDIKTEQYGHRELVTVNKDDYKKSLAHIGVNPIIQKPWNSNLRMVNFGLDSIIYGLGYDRRNRKYINDGFEEVNWDPFIINFEGEEIGYQRDFVWTLTQKQELIESIYNNIDIGKVVIRKRSYKWIKKRVINNKVGAFKDIVDGKQRLGAILDFITNKFTDKNGNYWSEFSKQAQSQFFNFSAIAYGELGEEATDEDVKSVFLGINFTGTPMSKEHINFVKSITLK